MNDYAAYFRLLSAEAGDVRGRQRGRACRQPLSGAGRSLRRVRLVCGCSQKRRVDDHLSLVAGITRIQRAELTNTQRRHASPRLRRRLCRCLSSPAAGREIFERVRDRPDVQFRRGSKRPSIELLPVEAGHGLCRLPEPSPGDLFLDLEGDPFAGEAGREDLFGLVSLDAGGRARLPRPLGPSPTEGRSTGVRTGRLTTIMAAVDGAPGHARLPLRAVRAGRASSG